MWRKSGTKLQGRYPATPSGGFMLGLDEFVYLAKSNLNLTIWLVQMHSKLASLVRNNIWTCQIVKFALDFAKNTNPSRPSINPPVGVAGSVLIYKRSVSNREWKIVLVTDKSIMLRRRIIYLFCFTNRETNFRIFFFNPRSEQRRMSLQPIRAQCKGNRRFSLNQEASSSSSKGFFASLMSLVVRKRGSERKGSKNRFLEEESHCSYLQQSDHSR